MKALRLCVIGWLALSWTAAARAEPLTIATYNVENYTLANRMVEGVYRKDYPKPEAQKDALRAVIRQLDADVLALQEIGGPAFLLELQRDLRTAGMHYEHAVTLEAEDRARMVAVLSRRPLEGVTRHDDLTFNLDGDTVRVRRGLLEVRIGSGAGEVTLFVVHLKSRHTERPEDPGAARQRAGEAVAVRDRVLLRFPEPAHARFLIVGDFNDGRTARPVRAMLDRGRTKISHWLPAGDGRGHVWTHFFRREDSYARVDHALASPGLMPGVRDARIHDSPEADRASDHRPLVVVLE